MCESPHFKESRGFALLAHNIFDSLRESGVVSVAEHVVVPAGTNSESVELNVVSDDALIILHLQMVKFALSVTSRIDQTKLCLESLDKCIPVF